MATHFSEFRIEMLCKSCINWTFDDYTSKQLCIPMLDFRNDNADKGYGEHFRIKMVCIDMRYRWDLHSIILIR